MPDWIVAVILGAIEGITEFLPVSSTGHLLLAEQWLPRQSDLFNVVIQSGTVLAVILVFTGKIQDLLFRWRDPKTQDYILKLCGAFFITGAGGLVLEKMDFKLPEKARPVALALLIGGILILMIEWFVRGRKLQDEITWPVAIAVGAAQLAAAIFPGLSRSGATILTALAMGASRPIATEFSFLLGIPTLWAAGAVKILHAWRHPGAEAISWPLLLMATVIAVITAFLSVRWLVRFVQTQTFAPFAWYRIALGLAILFLAAS